MNVQISNQTLGRVEADAACLLLCEDEAAPAEVNAAWIAELKASGEFTGKGGEMAIAHLPAGFAAKRLVLIGGGKRTQFDSAALRKAVGGAVRALKAKGVKTLAWPLNGGDAEAAAEGAVLADFEPDHHKSKKESKQLDTFILLADDSVKAAVDRGILLAESQNFTRELVNEPGNLLTPGVLAARAKAMAAESGLECEVLDQDRMKQLGMGSLLGVAQGSIEPPYLIVVRYKPEGTPKSSDHLGLVGKGVTFDTGGVSIKPSEGMEKMKYDMAGGAAVIGAMQAIAQLKPNVAVTAFIPTVENAIGGNAQRPGDIVTSLSGKTIEVLNTDAEGRLILVDAIEYAKRQGVTHMVDVATLTGAIVVALGHIHVGLFSNEDGFRQQVQSSAARQGEKMWHMPLDDEYREYLKSSFADIGNIGGRWGGAITAAYFLKEWVGETPWVHLDIAGTGWIDDNKPYMPKGPSGVCVRTFVDLALNWPA